MKERESGMVKEERGSEGEGEWHGEANPQVV